MVDVGGTETLIARFKWQVYSSLSQCLPPSVGSEEASSFMM